jgi:hypothetical protein
VTPGESSGDEASHAEGDSDAADEAFEAELRAEVQADLDERLAQADADSPEPDPGPELADEPPEGDPERGVWDDPDDDFDPDEDPGPVVMRPFPGMGGHNAIVGGGNLIAAFQEDVDPSAGYLVGELPGEKLLTVEGPQPNGSRQFGVFLAAGLCFAPCIAMGLGVERVIPPELERLALFTVIGATLLGLGLGAYLVNQAFYDPGRVVCTTEGLGIESGSVAAWLSWEEVWGYEREDEVMSLDSEQGAFSFTATEEEAEALISLLDRRGISRGRVSTRPPQATEVGPLPGGTGGAEAL